MSLLSDLNFFTTVLTFGCVSFAASNFGIKLGKLTSFKNTSGYEYISDSTNKDKLYQSIIDTDKPKIAQTAEQLKNWCEKHQKSIRWWKEASKYCLVRNNVRHQLIKDGYTPKTTDTVAGTDNVKCSDVFEMYADNTQSSLGYLLGKSKCFDAPASAGVPAAAAAA